MNIVVNNPFHQSMNNYSLSLQKKKDKKETHISEVESATHIKLKKEKVFSHSTTPHCKSKPNKVNNNNNSNQQKYDEERKKWVKLELLIFLFCQVVARCRQCDSKVQWKW